MSISNTKKNIFKKFLVLLCLSFFIFSFIVPLKTHAAVTSKYCYGSQSADNIDNATSDCYDKLSECETARTNYINKNNTQLYLDVSKCVKITKDYTVKWATTKDVINKDPLPWPTIEELFSGNPGTNTYFLMYHNRDNQYSIPSFLSKTECEKWWNTVDKTGYTLDTNCTKEKPIDPTTIKKEEVTINTDTSYTLLAPLDGLKTFESDPAKNPCAFGKYMNILIKLIIGIAAVLAMIMIIKGGFEYMTSSLPSGKESGKGTISQAILGLLIALGAYLLLYTLNPNLLNFCIDQQIPGVEITIQDEKENEDMAVTQDGSGNNCASGAITAICKTGMEKLSTSGGTFTICKDGGRSAKFKNMINAAWAANPQIKLTGGSCRSKDTQITLRTRYCGGSENVYNKSAKCVPLVAMPGGSRHENGLAADFKCNGVFMKSSSSPCFTWLKKNAETYGFKNLTSEPWHWSNDGR